MYVSYKEQRSMHMRLLIIILVKNYRSVRVVMIQSIGLLLLMAARLVVALSVISLTLLR